MIRTRTVALVALILAGCTHTDRSAIPSDAAKTRARVVLISYDGVGADPLERALRSGSLRSDGFALAATSGTRVKRIVPVTPTLTAVAHIAIATGARPEKTGIVSNTFHKRGDPIDKSTRGFNEEIDADTVWESALRQGKKVGAITFPGLDGNGPRRTADWGMVYSQPIGASRVITLERSDFSPYTSPLPLPPSFSPPLGTALEWKFVSEGEDLSLETALVALDSSDDQQLNYDIFLSVSQADGARTLDHSWFPAWRDVSFKSEVFRFGSWSKVLRSDPALASVELYLGAVNRTLGYPASYRRMIDEKAGFWPGPPDDGLAKKWLKGEPNGIEPSVFIEQLERFSQFFTNATLVSMHEMEWDLILGYQPTVDEAEHQFLLVNKRQSIQDPLRIAEAAKVRARAFQAVDSSFSRILRALPADAALVGTGDHGLAPVDKSVRLSRQLVEWGYASEEKGQIAKSSSWAAFSSGNFAHIYAFIPFSETERDLLIGKLRDWKDDEGQTIFEMVRARGPQDHENAGDILAATFPRYAFSNSLPSGPLFAKTDQFGLHGGLNHHPEFHTFLLAYGARVKRQFLESVPQTSIARYVSELLGIEPPRDAE